MLVMWQTCWLCKLKKRLHTGSVPREDRKRNTAISGGCLCWMTQKLPDSNLPTIQAFLDIFFITGKPFKAISAKDGILVVFVLLTKAYGIRRIFFLTNCFEFTLRRLICWNTSYSLLIQTTLESIFIVLYITNVFIFAWTSATSVWKLK